MKVSTTFSISIEDLFEFEKIIKQQNLNKSAVLNALLKEWLNENGNGQVVGK